MIQVFILCHEGEIPYVIQGLQDALQDDPIMQIISQGSTDKIHMGYVLLEGDEEMPPACLAELQANPDIYLYAVHGLDAADAQDDEGEEESEPARPARTPLPLEL